MNDNFGFTLIKFLKGLLCMTFLLCLLLRSHKLQAQQADSMQLQPQRLKAIGYSSAAAYTGLWIGLYKLWYADQPRTHFHFFNDNRQWNMMDKLGHSYSAFHLSRSGSEALKWAGMSTKKAAVYGSLSGFLWMLPIEIMDGYATEYGASWGDLAANGFGSMLYAGQQLLWQEIRIKPKFSFYPSSIAHLRPNVLGNHLPAQILKDYNGQTYWLSADLHTFLPKGNQFPRWINISLGYGAENMVYGHPEANRLAGHHSFKQFLIGPDFDFSTIRTNKKAVKFLLFLLDGIRLPAPALELNKNGIRFHAVYF